MKIQLTRWLREPGGPRVKHMGIWESWKQRVKGLIMDVNQVELWAGTKKTGILISMVTPYEGIIGLT